MRVIALVAWCLVVGCGQARGVGIGWCETDAAGEVSYGCDPGPLPGGSGWVMYSADGPATHWLYSRSAGRVLLAATIGDPSCSFTCGWAQGPTDLAPIRAACETVGDDECFVPIE